MKGEERKAGEGWEGKGEGGGVASVTGKREKEERGEKG